MSTLTTADILYEKAKTLPEPLVVEVLDFLEYLAIKAERHTPNNLTAETLRKARAGKKLHTTKDAADLFDALDIRFERTGTHSDLFGR